MTNSLTSKKQMEETKKYNQQKSIVYTYNKMRGDGTSLLVAILRVANLARSFGWTEQEIEEFMNETMVLDSPRLTK